MPDLPPTPHTTPHRSPDPLAALRGADPHAFEAFYAHYFPRVMAFSRRRASSERGAQKLTEAILEQAVRMLASGVSAASQDALVIDAARRLERHGH